MLAFLKKLFPRKKSIPQAPETPEQIVIPLLKKHKGRPQKKRDGEKQRSWPGNASD